jgi:hypothetical protein
MTQKNETLKAPPTSCLVLAKKESLIIFLAANQDQQLSESQIN